MSFFIFHCTNPKLVETITAFIPEIYETFTPYPDVNSAKCWLIIEITGEPFEIEYNT